MPDTLKVLSICGSLRKGSYNAAVARALPSLAPPGLQVVPAPTFESFPLYNQDIETAQGIPAAVTALADAIRSADGVIVTSPEYNWSIPGVLKNAIDWLSRVKNQPFKGKPVAIQSASPGLLGGARMQYHLRQVLASVDAVVFVKPEVLVTFAAQKFDEASLELKDQMTVDAVKKQLAAFESFVRMVTGKT